MLIIPWVIEGAGRKFASRGVAVQNQKARNETNSGDVAEKKENEKREPISLYHAENTDGQFIGLPHGATD